MARRVRMSSAASSTFLARGLVPDKTEDVVDAVVLTPRHRLRPGIVPVATERNSRLVPSRPDVPYQAAKMGTHLSAAWVLPDRSTTATGRLFSVS